MPEKQTLIALKRCNFSNNETKLRNFWRRHFNLCVNNAYCDKYDGWRLNMLAHCVQSEICLNPTD